MKLFCSKHGITDFTIRSSGKRICKKCETFAAKKYRTKIKENAIAYKGGCCSLCGYNKSIRCLDFHHRDPTKKEFSIGESRGGQKIVRNWEQLKPELDKCDLLCKNCHGEVHEKIDNDQATAIFNFHIHRKDVNLINMALIKNRKTPDQIIQEIESGKYFTETYQQININVNGKNEKLYLKE